MEEVEIRPYRVGDAEKIFNLFNKYIPYQRDEAFWVWINRLVAHSIISVAEIDGAVVGHYAILPRICILKDGTTLKAGLGIHAFVEPIQRNRVSIFSISALAFKLAKENNIQFVYGFPNINYRLIQEKIEKWKKVELFKSLTKKRANTFHALMFVWCKVEGTDYEDLFEINSFFDKRKLNYNCFRTDVQYWVKRYFSHPQRLYEIWKLRKDGLVIGYLVLKFFEIEGSIRLHIIDFLLIDDYKLTDILPDIEFKFTVVTELVFWPFNIAVSKTLRGYGFTEQGFDTYFGIKVLDKAIDSSVILDFSNWHLTMGDSDAF